MKITNPFKGAELKVANQDFSDQMTWEEANRACNKLCSGWCLPTNEKLKAMYEQLYKKGQGIFQPVNYWSNREKGSDYAWLVILGYGDGIICIKGDTNYLRAVWAC